MCVICGSALQIILPFCLKAIKANGANRTFLVL